MIEPLRRFDKNIFWGGKKEMKNVKKLLSIMAIALPVATTIPIPAEAACSHEWSEWSVFIEPGCTYGGSEERECKECWTTEYRDIPATGHDWGEWKVFESPTCKYDGEEVRTCKRCISDEYRKIPATGVHKWTEWEVFENANCTNDGKYSRYCSECYEYEYKPIPHDPNLHDWSSWYETILPTALKSGEAERNCYVCHTVEVKKVEKLKAKITISAKTKNLNVGKTFTLKLKKYTYGDEISKFTSSNKKVATVNPKGKVTAKKKGKAKITVTMKSGCKATCTVTVK